MKKTPNEIILETLDRLNQSLNSDENAILAVAIPSAPESGYVSLVAKLLALKNP